MKNKIVIITYTGDDFFVSPQRAFEKLYNTLRGLYRRVLFNIDIIPRIKKLIENDSNEVIVIGLDYYAQKRLREESIPYKTPDNYLSSEINKKAEEEAMSLIRKLPNLKDIKGLKEAAFYQGVPLWEMVELDLWGPFCNIIKKIELLKCVIDAEKPDKIFVIGEKKTLGKVMAAVGNLKKVPTLIIRQSSLSDFYHHFAVSLLSYVLVLFIQLRGIGRIITIGYDNRPKIGKPVPRKNKILMFSDIPTRDFPVAIPWLNEVKKNDKDEILIIELYKDEGERYQKEGLPFEIFYRYSNKEIHKKVNKEVKTLLIKWRGLRKSESFKKMLSYEGVSLYSSLEIRFMHLFLSKFMEIVETIEITKEVIEIEEPDIIIEMGDRNWYVKTVIAVGRLMKTPTLIIQHGMVADHPNYGPIYADKMAVWGKAMKDVLIKRGVRPDQLVVTGHPRYDIFYKKDFKKERIYHELKIDGDKRIIVLTTQPVSSKENEALLYGVINAMKNFPDKQLVIKLHPSEDPMWYQELIKEMGADDVIITKNVDLHELLNACDIMITLYSTTAVEAMILDKPVITINLMNKPDILPYAERGAAIGVYKSEDIAPTINRILYDEKTKQQLADNRKKFIYDWTYLSDGNASRRVADLIEEMLYNTRKNNRSTSD